MAEDQAAARAQVRTQLMEVEEANADIRAVNAALDKNGKQCPPVPSTGYYWRKAWRTN
jgi:hypothetical protein